MKRGDIVLVVAPGDVGKPRPGVVVQADELDGTSGVLICPMTSDVQESVPIRPVVELGSDNGLRFRSQIMTERLVALRRSRIKQVIGSIDRETTDRLDRALLIVLGLAR